MLTLLFSEGKENNESLDNFVYDSQVQKILSKKYLSVLNPEKDKEREIKQKEYEIQMKFR